MARTMVSVCWFAGRTNFIRRFLHDLRRLGSS
jgi:hypothetical protein